MINKLKLSIISFMIIYASVGCNEIQKKTEKEGGDKDEHGCIGSAGATWSVIKNNCIQVFNEGTQFTAYGTNRDSMFTAYIILSDDKLKAEVFLPSTYLENSVILDVAKSDNKNSSTLFENSDKMLKVYFEENKSMSFS